MNVFVQLRREIAAFFLSPMAYVLLTAAMVVNGGVFVVIVDFLSDPRQRAENLTVGDFVRLARQLS